MPSLPAHAVLLRHALEEAGRQAVAAWAPQMASLTKPDGTPVTQGDLLAEAILVDALRTLWPHDAVVTEESGGSRGAAAWWCVDPIDGTSSYLEGLAHWGPTVARILPQGAGSTVDQGAIYLPRLGEHYHVELLGPNRGAWFNGVEMAPFASRESRSTVYLPSRFHKHFRLKYAGKTRCIGGTAAHLALVARGAAEAVIVAPGWSTWDTAAGLGLIEVLGGRAVSLRSGAPIHPITDEGEPFVAGTPELVAALVRPGAIAPLPEVP